MINKLHKYFTGRRVKSWIMLIVMCMTMMVSLTGCGEAAANFAKSNLPDISHRRKEANIQIAQQLLDANLLSQRDYDVVVKQIETLFDGLQESIEDTSTQKALFASVSAVRRPRWVPQIISEENDKGKVTYKLRKEDGKVVNHRGFSEEDWKKSILTLDNSNGGDKILKMINIMNKKDIEPLRVISDEVAEALNKKFTYQLMVLRPDASLVDISEQADLSAIKTDGAEINNLLGDDGVGIDALMELVGQFVNNPTKETERKLGYYFMPATYKDEKGEEQKLTLFDVSKRKNLVACSSKGSAMVDDGWTATEDGFDVKKENKVNAANWELQAYGNDADNNILELAKANGFDGNNASDIPSAFNTSVWKAGKTDNGKFFHEDLGDGSSSSIASFKEQYFDSTRTTNYKEQPGYDMIVTQNNEAMLSLRLYEFNQEAVDNVILSMGMNEQQYFVFNDKIYLFEYPVQYIKEIKEDKGGYATTFAQSNIGINLITGKLIKYNRNTGAGGGNSKDGVPFNMDDSYLSLSGASNKTEETRASFALYGATEEGEKIPLGEQQIPTTVGRIVLRDYLEATYMPGLIDNEPLVVLGRKIRFLNFKHNNKSDPVAQFYGKQGLKLTDTADLYIDAFADYKALLDTSNQSVKYIGLDGENFTEEKKDTDSNDNSSGESKDNNSDDFNMQSAIKRIDTIPKQTVPSIEPSLPFPGPQIGSVDNTVSNKPLFYTMVIKDNPFRTALFSGWINSSNTAENSFLWWNQWLVDHNYQYKLNTTELNEYFKGNYSFEMMDEGYIILDLDTISKIQQEYDEVDKTAQSSWLRTTFIVLGVALIFYAFVICGCWALDTNVDLGFNILEKVSFGHWVAIKDKEEMPMVNSADRQYIDAVGLAKIAITIAVMGVMLSLINIVELVIALINIFGGIGKIISNIVFGMK